MPKADLRTLVMASWTCKSDKHASIKKVAGLLANNASLLESAGRMCGLHEIHEHRQGGRAGKSRKLIRLCRTALVVEVGARFGLVRMGALVGGRALLTCSGAFLKFLRHHSYFRVDRHRRVEWLCTVNQQSRQSGNPACSAAARQNIVRANLPKEVKHAAVTTICEALGEHMKKMLRQRDT